ncbi:MAG: hypothetical protein Q9160_003725 [Pyrenula sp. 1 TL-2023]
MSDSDACENFRDETETLRGSFDSALSTRSSSTITFDDQPFLEDRCDPDTNTCLQSAPGRRKSNLTYPPHAADPVLGSEERKVHNTIDSTPLLEDINGDHPSPDKATPSRKHNLDSLEPSGRRLSEAVRQFHAAREERRQLRQRIPASSHLTRAPLCTPPSNTDPQATAPDSTTNTKALSSTQNLRSSLTIEIGHLLRDLEIARAHRTELEALNRELESERHLRLQAESSLHTLQTSSAAKDAQLAATSHRLATERWLRATAESAAQAQAQADALKIADLESHLEYETQNRIFAEVNIRILRQWLLANQEDPRTRRHARILREDLAREAVGRWRGSVAKLQTKLVDEAREGCGEEAAEMQGRDNGNVVWRGTRRKEVEGGGVGRTVVMESGGIKVGA